MYSLSRILQSGKRLGIGSSWVACARLEVSSSLSEATNGVSVPSSARYDTWQPFPMLNHTRHVSSNIFLERRALSSSMDVKSSGEVEDLEDGFSELDIAASEDNTQVKAEDDSLSGLSDDEDGTEEPLEDDLELSDAESDPSKEKSVKRRAYSELYKAIVANPGLSVSSVLDAWLEEKKDLSREEISLAMLALRRQKMYGRALKLLEGLEANKQLQFVEKDYASRLDLIAKVHGLHEAESYINKIPEALRGEYIYRTLLANCVIANNVKKAVEVFDKMKDLKFPLSSFACNQMLMLYRRNDMSKIADVLSFMEKQNVKPTRFTYKILINIKGFLGDITGMEQIVETMKAEGIDLDQEIQTCLARHYASAGLKEKALEFLKEAEGEGLKANPWVCRSLLPVYAELGKADEVERIWAICEQNPRFEHCIAAIEAWGKLKKIEKAEAVFDKMVQKWKNPSSKPFYALMTVYASNKMLTKGKELVKLMAESGLKIDPWTWDALVKLYVEAGEVEKADSILNKVAQESQMKPLFNSFMVILEQYARRGDVHNAEKIFHRMRQAGYVPRLRQYQALVLAYMNAKTPAYGMRERLKGDHIYPSKPLAAQLVRVDAFRKTVISDIID